MESELIVFIYVIGLFPNWLLPFLLMTKKGYNKKIVNYIFLISFIPIINVILLVIVFISLTISIIKHKD